MIELVFKHLKSPVETTFDVTDHFELHAWEFVELLIEVLLARQLGNIGLSRQLGNVGLSRQLGNIGFDTSKACVDELPL